MIDPYKCLHFPYPIGKGNPAEGTGFAPPDQVIPVARQFIKNWKASFPGGQIYVELQCFKEPKILYVNSGFRHIQKESRSPAAIAKRYRFLPCVRELLEKITQAPEPTKDGNLMFLGKTAPYNELFKVILGVGELPRGGYGYKLITFYPINRK